MSVQATTPQAIRALIENTILAITPSYAEITDNVWHLMDADEDPRGTDCRNFTVLTSLGAMEGDGLLGCDTIPKAVDLIIRVSYGGLIGNSFSDTVNADASDIWRALHPLPGGLSTPANGIIAFEGFLTLEPDEDPGIGEYESSSVTVDFLTTLRFHSE